MLLPAAAAAAAAATCSRAVSAQPAAACIAPPSAAHCGAAGPAELSLSPSSCRAPRRQLSSAALAAGLRQASAVPRGLPALCAHFLPALLGPPPPPAAAAAYAGGSRRSTAAEKEQELAELRAQLASLDRTAAAAGLPGGTYGQQPPVVARSLFGTPSAGATWQYRP